MFQRRVTFLSLIFLDKCFNQQLRLSDLLRTYWYYWSKHTKSSVSKFFKKKKKHKSRHIYSAAREVSPEILNSYKKIKSPNKSLHYSSYLTDCYKHIC